MPDREITVNIAGNDYVIKLPTTGQEIDIESLKDQMTGGSHKNTLMGDNYATDAYFSTSAIATFEVLLPDLKKDLLVKSLRDLDMSQIRPVREAWLKYHRWIQSWKEYINKADVDGEQ